MKNTKNDSKHQFFRGVRKIAFIDHQHFGKIPFHRGGEKTLSGRSERTFFPGGKQLYGTQSAAGRPGFENERGNIGPLHQLDFRLDPVIEDIGLVFAG